jgi:hypothetical protein
MSSGLAWDPAELAVRSGLPAPDAEDDGTSQACPACGDLNDAVALFCAMCGAMLPDGDEDEDDEDAAGGDASRFNPAEVRAPAGAAAAGQWTAGAAGGAAAKPAAAAAAKPAAAAGAKPPTAAQGKAAADAREKAGLLKQAAADRAKAHELGKELAVLEHQHAAQVAAAAKLTAAGKKAAKKAPSTASLVAAAKNAGKPAAAKTTARKTKRAASLTSRITHVKGQISDLNAKASALVKKASKL